MIMPSGVRKLTLAIHLSFSVGWIGAVVAYLALGLVAATSRDAQTLRASWIAMDLTGWYVIVPLALASLVTGVVMALGTKWGLFRHYWVLVSLLLTVVAAGVLLLHMPDVSALATAAREAEGAGQHLYTRLDDGDLLHPALGLVVLLVIQVLNVYKPQGMTRYGWRKQEEHRKELQRSERKQQRGVLQR
jgi:Predicted integral membrane protein (DUF2269)